MPAFPWQFFIGAIAALGLLLGGVHIGRVYERAGFIEADLTRAEKVIVKVKTERVIEEKGCHQVARSREDHRDQRRGDQA
jgi:hypothetical protein